MQNFGDFPALRIITFSFLDYEPNFSNEQLVVKFIPHIKIFPETPFEGIHQMNKTLNVKIRREITTLINLNHVFNIFLTWRVDTFVILKRNYIRN